MKDASHKRLHIVQFHLYEMSMFGISRKTVVISKMRERFKGVGENRE